jgi:hypothetical protein
MTRKVHLQRWFLRILCVPVSTALLSIPALAAEYAAILSRVTDDARYFSSDEREGRGPGTGGLEEAADYIREEFQKLGLRSGTEDGSYFQPFEVTLGIHPVAEKTTLTLNGPDGQSLELKLGGEFQAMAAGGAGKLVAPVVFAGYGISAPKKNYDDYAGSDVAGKVVLVIRREPQQDDPTSVFDGEKTTSYSFIRTKLQQAKKKKAAAVLMVNDPFSTSAGKRDELSSPTAFGSRAAGIPFAQLSQATVDQVLGITPVKGGDGASLASISAVEDAIDEACRPLSQPLEGWSAELQFTFEPVQASVANVVGVLEGEGPLADETIIVGAHYDHIGRGEFGSRRPNSREVHNGADDNASGTTAILEMARRLAERDSKPPRRLVFIAFSAEEKGLLGAKHYLEHPLYPLDDTVAMFNYDMVGRLRGGELTINGIRSAREFSELVDKANAGESLKLKKIERVLRSSDHFAFYQRGVPSFHFFTGFTDEYHTPDDDFETLNMEGLVQTVDYTERLLDSVMALPQRPQFVKTTPSLPVRGGAAYLGVIPDYAAGEKGLRVSEVVGDSPAAKGGLKAGDVILQLGEISITDVPTLIASLRKYKPGDMVKVTVRRAQEKVACNVTLGRP